MVTWRRGGGHVEVRRGHMGRPAWRWRNRRRGSSEIAAEVPRLLADKIEYEREYEKVLRQEHRAED